MPNWCENELSVSGPGARAFLRENSRSGEDEETLSLAKSVPCETTIDGHIQSWGTKWDVDADVNDVEEDHVYYTFLSAWSPPTDWLRIVGAKYPRLSFELRYEEVPRGVET